MRTMSPTLITLLNTGNQFYMADLYSVAMKNGTTLRYTTAENPITFSENTYASQGLLISRNGVRWVVGAEVDTLELHIGTDGTTLVNGLPIITAALQGQFDGAQVSVDRLFLTDWSTPVGSVNLFAGKVSNLETHRTSIDLTVKSNLEALIVQMPPNLYQASCLHTLYDVGCTVRKTDFTTTATCGGLNVDGSLITSLSNPDTYFNMGAVKITDGPNNGLVRTVKNYVGGKVYLTKEFPNAIAVGTSFEISPGCDKLRQGDCTAKFNNVINFKGFEYIPVPETAA